MRAGSGTIFFRLWIAAPLLYILLLMAIDPAGFVRFSEKLALVLRTFERRIHGVEWRISEPDFATVSKPSLMVLRFVGLALAVCVILYLAGIAE